MFSTKELNVYEHKAKAEGYVKSIQNELANIQINSGTRPTKSLLEQMYAYSPAKMGRAVYHYSKALECAIDQTEYRKTRGDLRYLLFAGSPKLKKGKIFEAIKTLPASQAYYLLSPCLDEDKKNHTELAKIIWESRYANYGVLSDFLGEKAKSRLGEGILKDIESYLKNDCFADYRRDEMEKKFKEAEQTRAEQAKAEYDVKKAEYDALITEAEQTIVEIDKSLTQYNTRKSERDAWIKEHEEIQEEFERIERELDKLPAKSEHTVKQSVDFSTSVSNAITCVENDEADKPLLKSPPPLPAFKYVERPAVKNQEGEHNHLSKEKTVDQFEVTDEYVMKTPSGKSKFLPDFNLNININLNIFKTSPSEENKKLKRVPTVPNNSKNVVFSKISNNKL